MTVGNWKWLVHPEFGAHRVPDHPAVVADFEARDWVATDVPGDLDIDSPEVAAAVADAQPKADEDSEDTGKAKSAAKSKKEAE